MTDPHRKRQANDSAYNDKQQSLWLVYFIMIRRFTTLHSCRPSYTNTEQLFTAAALRRTFGVLRFEVTLINNSAVEHRVHNAALLQ